MNQKRNCLRCKRGNYAFDVLWIMIFIFILAGGVLIGKLIVGELHGATDKMDIPDEAKDMVETIDDGYVSAWDGLFLFTFIILVGALWFSSWIIDAHPIFFIVTVVLVIIFTIINMILSTIFDGMFSNNSMSSIADQFIIIPFFMDNLVIIMLVVAIITGVLLYSKRSAGGME